MSDFPDPRPDDPSAHEEEVDVALDEQLEKLHEHVVAGETSILPSSVDNPMARRLQAAHQLLELIEKVRSAETAGILEPSEPPVDTLLVDLRKPLGPYQLTKEIGRGGMGIVFLARDARLGRDVAVKIVAPRGLADSEWKSRFHREARAASALNHPNILTVFEIGETSGQHYIATELVDGETLRKKFLAKNIAIDEAIHYTEQLASALSAAHSAGIIHRDLKPDNIMIRPDGLVKILDFGLAKPMHEADATCPGKATRDTDFASQPGIILGTIQYMSPEQARGLPLDARSDIFSLGVVIYEMVTGHHPFEAATLSDVLSAILDRAPIPLSEYRNDIPTELIRIVLKCMSKVREQRYPSAVELLDDLRRSKQARETGTFGKSQLEAANLQHRMEQQDKDGSKEANQKEIPDAPPVFYALSGNVNIAYQVLGDGPFDLVFVMGWVSHLEWFWQEPSFANFLRRLATFSRVILFDKRGTGLSDKVPVDQLPTLEQRMDDVRAVMDAVGSQRAVLCGVSEGGPMCTLFAATYPEKTTALAMIGCYARRLWAPDYPWGPTEEQRQHFLDEIRRDWGGPVGIEVRAPSRARDPQFRRWWASYLRMGASPGAALALTNMNAQIDIRPILPTIQVPTLVIHRSDDQCLRVEEGRYLAQQISGSKFVELPGADHLPFVGDQVAILNELEEFLTGVRQPMCVDRILATILYVAIVSVSEPEKQSGEGSSIIQKFSSHVIREVDLFKGRMITLDAHCAVAGFDGPARAIRAAIAINDSARRLGVRVRTGIHTGECDRIQDVLSGPTMELSRDIARQANLNDILLSSTVKDLVVGSGIPFIPHSYLRNTDPPRELFQVAR
jgi:serine/threonine protein kinase/alpha-beta hydrolase superfamily lysophospholipase/class 3 adenylate cyclase